ncbi:MAG: glycosyltransferase family 4 protein [Culicoidibacterales bacterium]
MKKIAFIVSALTMGGVQKITVQLANELAKKSENRVEIIVLNGTESYYETECKVTFLNVHYNFANKVIRKVSNEFIHNLYLSNHLYFKALKKHFKKRNYDTIIASDGHMTMLLNELNVSSVKKIGWMHNEYDTYMNNYYSAFKKKFCISLKNMDNLVVLTKQDQEQYQKHNPKTKAIYNPLTVETSKIANLDSKEILFVGRISREQKGLDILLDVIQQTCLNDWNLKIVGEGKDTEWLENEIQKRDLTNKIILHGPVKEDIDEIYANASVFVSTSRWEGFGLVITEAMSCGLPVIAFENAGPKEIIDRKYGILVPKKDTDLFAKELSRLIENNDELERYQKLSLQRSKDFKIDKIIQEWEEIINEK